MQFRAALIAGAQAAQVVQPGKAALDDPALAAEAGSMAAAATGDDRFDTATAQLATVLVVVVAAICQEPSAALLGPADLPPHRSHAVDQGQELSDVVAVTTGQSDRQWNAVGVGQEMMLGAATGAVDR